MTVSLESIQTFLFVVIRAATPFIFVALAAVISHQAGLINLSIESMALTAALVGVLVSGYTQNLWIAFLCGVISSMAIAGILCFASFYLKVNIPLMSIALNTAVSGATIFIMFVLTGSKANTSTTIPSLVFPQIDLPLIENIPFLGKVLSGHNLLTYLAFIMVFAVWFLVYKTTLGLRIRAIGQNPKAAEAVGINVNRLKTVSFLLSAVVASLCGMYMSMGYVQWFARDMVAGRGFIGISASTIAGASPVGATLASFVFTFAYVVNTYLRLDNIDANLVSAIPYALSFALLNVFSVIRLKKRQP